jgi:hypothetical protein
MDVRVYVAVQDAIDTAISMADLKTARVLVGATRMEAAERQALERRLATREVELRAGGHVDAARVRGPNVSSGSASSATG